MFLPRGKLVFLFSENGAIWSLLYCHVQHLQKFYAPDGEPLFPCSLVKLLPPPVTSVSVVVITYAVGVVDCSVQLESTMNHLRRVVGRRQIGFVRITYHPVDRLEATSLRLRR